MNIIDGLNHWQVGDGLFRMEVARNQRGVKDPVMWWMNYGHQTPNLRDFTMKILSLTTSSSGCERNWSVWEHLHSKRRNRLEHQRLNDLVFIKYNRQLKRRWENRKVIDPISLDEIDYENEWMSGVPDDANDELVFNDGDELTWGEIVKYSGVDEAPYSLRNISRNKIKGESSKGKGKKKVDTYQLVDEDEDEDDDDEAYADDFVDFVNFQDTEPPFEGDD